MSDELVTVPNITLISVGSWLAGGSSPGKSKEVVFTEDDLKNIMASLEAPDVKEPRMILGHTPPTEGPGMSAVADEGFFGEQPAIGKFINCHLTADNQDIVGDLVGVPAWLAKILPTAYPNRSVEVYWDVPSGIPGAANHACIMPRVALLGTNLPAVATLEDLRVFFSEDGPELPEPDLANATRRIAASRGEQMPQRAAASVQFEDVRREFYNNFATEASGRYWWWITAVYVDPSTLIVDDEEESLWSVPYTVSGDAVEFGEPVKIKVQYVEEESGKVAASRDVASSSTERHYTKAASRPDDRKRPPKEAVKMGLDLTALRERTGLTVEQLPDDATEEQINTALAAKPAEPVEPVGGGELEATPPGEGEQVPAGAAAASAEPSGTITVDRAAWEEQQRTTAALHADLQTRVAAARDSTVLEAIKAGKIPPSRKDHYVKLMTVDPEGTTTLLAELEAVIPVEQRETGVAESGGSQASSEAYDLSWLSDAERARVEAARAGTTSTPRLVLEG
jgi:hypothetical protein